MVKAKNLSTFAYLKRIVHYFLKQMTLQYISRILLLVATVAIFSSCLKSEQSNPNWSPDAQIYAFSLSASKDASRVLAGTKFTIDQLQEKIFNQDSLPYLFKVDSVMPKIVTNDSKITLYLKDKDSTYVWNGKDSVAINRLVKITSMAQNGKSSITYAFQLNTHKQDPNVLTWSKLQTGYITGSVDAQKTVLLGDKFITYYKSGAEIKGASSASNNGKTWNSIHISGLPLSVQFKSILSASGAVYALDANNALYKTSNGAEWTVVNTQYPIKALLGDLPLPNGGAPVLVMVNDGGVLKFATTKDNFTSLQLETTLPPADIPVKDFFSLSLNSPITFAAKYIVLTDGLKADNKPNNRIWLIQKKEGKIEIISPEAPMSLEGSSIFFYNNRLYLLGIKDNKNILSYSNDFGLNWRPVNANQALPAEFSFRKYASIITDTDNYIWIFGGTGASQQVVDVWRGKLNALGN